MFSLNLPCLNQRLSLFILPYPILLYPILSYPTISYPILRYPILPHPTLSHPILSYPIPFHSIPSHSHLAARQQIGPAWWSSAEVAEPRQAVVGTGQPGEPGWGHEEDWMDPRRAGVGGCSHAPALPHRAGCGFRPRPHGHLCGVLQVLSQSRYRWKGWVRVTQATLCTKTFLWVLHRVNFPPRFFRGNPGKDVGSMSAWGHASPKSSAEHLYLHFDHPPNLLSGVCRGGFLPSPA